MEAVGKQAMAISQWKTALGNAMVMDEQENLQTFLADVAEYPQREAVAKLKVRDVCGVQEALRYANANGVPVYPVSTGRNWGFGSAKPVANGCAVLDLSGMDQIRELDLQRGYAIVEPGVTQRVLSEALRGTSYMLNTTGSCSDTSVIGNALERGVGFIRQRTEDILGLEVVLANGDVVRVGSFWSNDLNMFHYRHGVGPDLLPMFFQSNFGVVTAAVVSLIPQPECMRLVQAQFHRDVLEAAIDEFADLYRQGLLRVNCKAFNTSAMDTYGINPDSHFDSDSGREFTFYGALMGASITVECMETLVLDQLERTGIFHGLRSIDRDLWASEVPDHIALPFQGIPTCEYIQNSFGTCCRKADSEAKTGMFLFAPVVPFDGRSVKLAYNVIDNVAADNDMPINASMNMISPTTIDLVLSTPFVRRDKAIAKVHEAKEQLQRELRVHGFFPYRVDIEHQDPHLLYGSETLMSLLSTMKNALDPNNIIAPNRYVAV